MEVCFPQESIIRLIQEYLVEANLAASARALELESGCQVQEANDDLSFARELALDGRWGELEDFLAPLAHARGFDHAGVLFAVRRQRFLELLSGRLRGGGGGGDANASTLGGGDSSMVNASMGMNASLLGVSQGPGAAGGPGTVLQVVAALRAVEPVCDSRAAYNSLCYCLTLPSVNDHPDFKGWSPHSGRHAAYQTVRRELLKVFPADSAAPSATPGQLHKLLCQAAVAQLVSRVASDPRLIPVRAAAARSAAQCATPFHAALAFFLTPHPLHPSLPPSPLSPHAPAAALAHSL